MVRQRGIHIVRIVAAVLLFLVPAAAWAQTGTIAGTVKDTTGAVMPGVTVEAASPALIEKVRTAVSDSQGEYKIVDLRPGIYTVTFTLTGFNIVKRDEVELTAGITVNISPELRIGTLEETITVSGQSPVVDVQNTTQHTAVTRSIMDNLPTGRQFGNYAVLIPGIITNQQDVGGNGMVQSTTNMMGVHGSNATEMPMLVDGMRYSNIFGTGGGAAGPYLVNNGMVQEIAIDTSGQGAEAEVSGVRANIILKQGANQFSSSWFGSYGNDRLIKDNLDDALRARNVASPATVNRIWDFTVGVGGPLKKDKVWFYGSYRNYGIYVTPVGAFHAVDPAAIIFVPGERAINQNPAKNYGLRATLQTSKSSTLSLYGDHQTRCICANGLGATTAYEATTKFVDPGNALAGLFQAVWNWTLTNKLLLEFGETFKPDSWSFEPQTDNLALTHFPVLDLGTGINSGANSNMNGTNSTVFNGKATLTYVTGSHNLKVGSQWYHGTRTNVQRASQDIRLNLVNRTPVSVTQFTTPNIASENVDLNLGIYAQEQYTLKRVTANLGVRYDHLKASVLEQHRAPVRYVGARDFAAIENVPNWNDITPRLGVSWDVFGNGKTALKVSLGKYLETVAGGFPEAVNPMRGTGGTTATRPWDDRNGNLFPDCDLTNLATNGECGPIDNRNFGKAIVPIRYDPAVSTGWGTRGYNWEFTSGVQQELRSGLSAGVGYFRRAYGNFRVFQNVATPASAFDPYCVTTPADPRLPGGGGQKVCGFYDINPSSGLFGAADIVITKASNIGKISEIYDGVDITGNWRGPKGFVLQGGVNVGRLETNYCGAVIGRPDIVGVGPYVNQSSQPNVNVGPTAAGLAPLAQVPSATAFCDVNPPFIPQVKLLAVFPLPWYGLQTSATLQSIRYPQEFSLVPPGILAQRSYSTAEISPSLGRDLAGGARNALLSIMPPGTSYEGRIYQLDFRVTKNFTARRGRIQPQFDVYNLFNDNTVLTANYAYGPAWQRPLTFMQGRTFKFGLQADF